MANRPPNRFNYGPWLVGIGAALWGTESAWRIPLNELFDAKVIVFWEHVLILIMFLPILFCGGARAARAAIRERIPAADTAATTIYERMPAAGTAASTIRELRRIDGRTWGFLVFSGFAGSAVGTIFFTLALKYGNPTVVNVILNIQPVISTLGAVLIFGDKLSPKFFPYAAIAIVAGMFLSVEHPELIGVSFAKAGLTIGTGYALVCAFFWAGATVAGRGVMLGMSLRLASSMRIVVGLVCMTIILLGYGELNGADLWPAAAQAHPTRAFGALVLLASISGGIPLLIYFEGLRRTRASTAGYFEMMQTLAAVCITWGFFHAALRPHQIIAGLILIAAVTMVQRVQAQIE